MHKNEGQTAIILIVVFCLVSIMIGFIFFWPGNKKASPAVQTTTTQTAPTQPAAITTAPTGSATSGTAVAPTSVLAAPVTGGASGTGTFACSPDGQCRAYSEDVIKANCPKRFADVNCSNQCADKSIQCKI